MDRGEAVTLNAQLLALASVVIVMPLEDLINSANSYDTITPIVDPTRWNREHRAIEHLKKLAEALLPFKAECTRQMLAEEDGERRLAEAHHGRDQ